MVALSYLLGVVALLTMWLGFTRHRAWLAACALTQPLWVLLIVATHSWGALLSEVPGTLLAWYFAWQAYRHHIVRVAWHFAHWCITHPDPLDTDSLL